MNEVSPARTVPSGRSGHSSKERTILVVDDARSVREYLTSHLVEADYTVVTAVNGQEALELSSTQKFDLVLCDMHMPEMDGATFRLEMLKKGINAATPFLAMSSNDSVENLKAMQQLHAAAFLTKPFKPQQLLMQVERLIAEAALRESEERFRTVADHTYAWEYWLGPDRRMVWMSPSCERVTGYSVGEFMDDPDLPLKIVYHEDRALMEDHLQHHVHECASQSLDYRIKTKDGKVRWLAHSCQPVYDSQGNWAGRRACNLDFTERKHAEQFREDVERIVRHDLKSPTNAIITLSTMLLDEGGFSAEQREMLEYIEDYSQRMLRMLDMSLRLFKMEQGTFQLNAKPVDLIELLGRAGIELRDLLTSRNRNLRLVVRGVPASQDESFVVVGDELLLYSMLTNLVRNALEAAPPDSTITVSLDEDASVQMRVHNLGSVPPEIRGRFFEKYATAGKTYGTGLGTYAAKLIAHTHGGSITMETSEEAGTTVAVVLPK